MKKIIVLLTLTLLSTLSFGQQASSEALTRTFFEKYQQNTDEAFDFIFATNAWMASDDKEQVKRLLKTYTPLMGDYLGYEKLAEQSLGDSLKMAVYLVKYERQPLRFIFKYYKNKAGWVLYNIKFDDNIDDELDKAMKRRYLEKQ